MTNTNTVTNPRAADRQAAFDAFLDEPVESSPERNEIDFSSWLDADEEVKPVISTQEKPKEAPANLLIEKCVTKSKSKFESGVTSTMREGAIEYSGCLEAVILKQAERIYPKEQQHDAKKEIRQQLDALSKATIGFYWRLENENQWCDSSCGTMWHVTPYPPYHEILEKMIRQMVLIEHLNTTED